MVLVSLVFVSSIPALPLLGTWWCWKWFQTGGEEGRKAMTWAMTIFLAATLGSVFMPVKQRPLSGRLWDWALEYFSVRVVYRGGKPLPRRQYLYCMAPHGLYPFAGGCASVSSMVDVFPGIRFAVARVGFLLPVTRYFCLRLGAISADRESISSTLSAGDSVGIWPGGVAEMMRTELSRERIVLQPRLGFVREALKLGVPIVPVYVFGQSVLLSHVKLPQWVETIGRVLRISIIIPYGRFGLLVPRREPLLYAIGDPIECPRMEGGVTDEQVRETHAKVVAAMRDLYDTYKEIYGWKTRDLSIE